MAAHVITVKEDKICMLITSKIHLWNKDKTAKKAYLASWDTGSNKSLISPKAQKEAGLELLGESNVVGINDKSKAVPYDIYPVNIEVFDDVAFFDVPMLCAEPINNGIDVVLGMDIISNGDFAISNFNGKTTFTFRCPSKGEIDFNEI